MPDEQTPPQQPAAPQQGVPPSGPPASSQPAEGEIPVQSFGSPEQFVDTDPPDPYAHPGEVTSPTAAPAVQTPAPAVRQPDPKEASHLQMERHSRFLWLIVGGLALGTFLLGIIATFGYFKASSAGEVSGLKKQIKTLQDEGVVSLRSYVNLPLTFSFQAPESWTSRFGPMEDRYKVTFLFQSVASKTNNYALPAFTIYNCLLTDYNKDKSACPGQKLAQDDYQIYTWDGPTQNMALIPSLKDTATVRDQFRKEVIPTFRILKP